MHETVYCELPQFGLIRFTGEDAQAFLHNQLTCDVAALAPDRSTYGGYCTPKGRLLATFLLWRSEQGFFMQLPASLCESIRKQLSKFILRSKVKAADGTADWELIGVAGRDAAALVQRAAGVAPRRIHEITRASDATVIHLPVDRYAIFVTRNRAARIVESLCPGADRVEPEHWDWLDIRAGVPVIHPATQEAFVPQMANLDLIGALSYTKGCYPGQEIVARTHYLGRLKSRMYLANIAASDKPQPGDKLYCAGLGEQASGAIVSAARSPEGGYDALAVIQSSAAGSGDVHWKALDGPVLKRLPMPYPIPGSE
ncbi:MAG TPA: folate-binding protein YgfZ [Burkholderiales bacterium]|nr:folate-binding protein YgfZ [Burkholderiales bacterium]